MTVDVFAVIDDDALKLRRPMLPVTESAYAIPIFVRNEPRASWFPGHPHYNPIPRQITAVLIGGRRFPLDRSPGPVPAIGMYKIHDEPDAQLVCVGLGPGTLWQYGRVEVVAVNEFAYSMRGSREPDGEANPPTLLEVPGEITQRADALAHGRMSFQDVGLTLAKGAQSVFMYGGEVALSLRHRDDATGETWDYPLGRHVMTGIAHDMETAKITAIDYRYLLNAKYPFETFEREGGNGHPFLEDRHVGAVKPEMIGIGNGIPGVCLNGLQIYKALPALDKVEFYDFRFPPGFRTHLDDGRPDPAFKIEVRMNSNTLQQGIAGQLDGGWIEVWPGLGNPRLLDTDARYRPEHPAATRPRIDAAAGIVQIHFLHALKNSQHGNDPCEARMYARWPCEGTREAITRLLDLAGDYSLKAAFTGEFDGLAPVGLFMDESRPAFEWIERLQAGNVIGGQLFLVNDALKFRQENPNRPTKLSVPDSDALNHETLGVEVAEDFMYSGWEISYVKCRADGDEGRLVGTNRRYPTAPILVAEDATAFLERQTVGGRVTERFNVDGARRRERIIRDLTNTFRHRVNGLVLPMAREYLELLVFDVIEYLPRALAEQGHRPKEWTIYKIGKNVTDGTVTLDLVERAYSEGWRHPAPPPPPPAPEPPIPEPARLAISFSGVHDFGGVRNAANAVAPEPLEATVFNVGGRRTGGLSVSVRETEGFNVFLTFPSSLPDIPPGGEASFSVRPQSLVGHAPRRHSATVTASRPGLDPVSFGVTVEVLPPPPYPPISVAVVGVPAEHDGRLGRLRVWRDRGPNLGVPHEAETVPPDVAISNGKLSADLAFADDGRPFTNEGVPAAGLWRGALLEIFDPSTSPPTQVFRGSRVAQLLEGGGNEIDFNFFQNWPGW